MTNLIQLIPLNKLVPSPRNVRRNGRKTDLDMLAASIASRGLLQNLCVVATDTGVFEVDAGGRRLAALKKLARDKVIAKDYPVPCNVIAPEEGVEVSLLENVQRVGMDALDEVDAFSTLVAEGHTPDDVANRFGVTRRHVDQRLALAGLSPKLKAAWKRGDLNLDAARAFCLVSDHARQEAVFRSLGKPVTHAGQVRARLMEGCMRAGDRVARFVGLEAYERAGGVLRRDLFDADAIFVEDPALMHQLALASLESAIPQWTARGWGWVEANLDGHLEGLAPARLQPSWRDPTPDEQTSLNEIEQKLEALDAELEASSSEDDARWSQRDDLEAAYETIRQQARVWDEAAKASAGVMLTISHDGAFTAVEGLVRKEDQKKIDAARRATVRERTEDDGTADGRGGESGPTLPKGLVRELTQARTVALANSLAAQPDIALAVAVAALIARLARHDTVPGVAISASGSEPGDLVVSGPANGLAVSPPEQGTDLLAWCLVKNRDDLLVLLTWCVASTLSLAHEGASSADAAKQAVADALAQAVDLDMSAHWTPDLDFWMRLSKDRLIEEFEGALEMTGLAEAQIASRIKDARKWKKDALASRVEAAWRGRGYLPDVLVTPLAEGALTVTDAVAGAA